MKQHPPSKPGEISVLLVDDDEDWLELSQQWLCDHGFEASISVNGEDIWEKIADVNPQVILLDIAMRGISGEKICKAVKANPQTKDICIIMFSSNDNIETITLACGADGFISKSLPFQETAKKILEFA